MKTKTILSLERMERRHEQLSAARHRTEAEEADLEALSTHLHSIKQAADRICEKVVKLEAMLLKHGIRMTDNGIERLH